MKFSEHVFHIIEVDAVCITIRLFVFRQANGNDRAIIRCASAPSALRVTAIAPPCLGLNVLVLRSFLKTLSF